MRSNRALEQAGFAKVNQMLHVATLVALADALAICIGEILLAGSEKRGPGKLDNLNTFHIYTHTHT